MIKSLRLFTLFAVLFTTFASIAPDQAEAGPRKVLVKKVVKILKNRR